MCGVGDMISKYGAINEKEDSLLNFGSQDLIIVITFDHLKKRKEKEKKRYSRYLLLFDVKCPPQIHRFEILVHSQ